MAGQGQGGARRDSTAVVREFVADWKAGKAKAEDARAIAGDLETVRARVERVRLLHPQAGVELGEEVQVLLKLVGRQRSISRPSLSLGLRRAASLL